MNYEGEEIGDFFLQEFFHLSKIQLENFIKISDFLVTMIEIYSKMLDEGMMPKVIRIPKSPKQKTRRKKFYPQGNPKDHHSFRCLQKGKHPSTSSQKENINWFMWNNPNKINQKNTSKPPTYSKGSKVGNRSVSKSLKEIQAPDLSRGRYEKNSTKARSTREIED
jgi:hypothetical protein